MLTLSELPENKKTIIYALEQSNAEIIGQLAKELKLKLLVCADLKVRYSILKTIVSKFYLKALPIMVKHGGANAKKPCCFCSLSAPRDQQIDGSYKLGISWSKYLGLEEVTTVMYDGVGTSNVVKSIMDQMGTELLVDIAVMPALHLLLSLNGLIKMATNASKLGKLSSKISTFFN